MLQNTNANSTKKHIPIYYDQPVTIKNIDSLVFSIPLCFTETSLIANTKYSQKCEHKNVIPQIAQERLGLCTTTTKMRRPVAEDKLSLLQITTIIVAHSSTPYRFYACLKAAIIISYVPSYICTHPPYKRKFRIHS